MEHKKLRTHDPKETEISEKFLEIEYALSEKLSHLVFSDPIFYVYNPLEYARELHVNFVRKYYNTPGVDILFLGMNPGPWGMSQTGIPFGDSRIVRDWFHIGGRVKQPEKEHPKRIVSGLNCKRAEVSGTKFWGLIRQICGCPEKFFKHCFIYNICPLAFLSNSGANVTPAEIKVCDSKILIQLCDEALAQIIKGFGIKVIIGIGQFSEKRAISVLKNKNITDVKVTSIPHPSPRNKKYYSNWETVTVAKLQELGVYQLLDKNQT